MRIKCYQFGCVRLSGSDAVRLISIWLLVIFLFFPRGIGFSVYMGSVLDVNKAAYLFLIVFVFMGFINKFFIAEKCRVGRVDLILVFILLSSFLFSLFWKDSAQYIVFFYQIIFGYSAFFVSRYIFSDVRFFYYFVNLAFTFILVSSLFSIADYFFDFIPFDVLRADDDWYSSEKSRGDVLGDGVQYVGYKGFDYSSTKFAFERFVWFSFGVILLVRFSSYSALFKYKTVFVSVFVMYSELIMSQSRFQGVVASLILLFSLKYILKNRNIRGLFLFYVLLAVLFLATNYDVFLYYLYSIIGLFSFSGLEISAGAAYTLETDKRYISIASIIENIENVKLYMPAGPMFFEFSESHLGVLSDNWDDTFSLLSFFLEYGLISFIALLFLVGYSLVSKGNGVNVLSKYMVLSVIIAAVPSNLTVFTFYLLFFLGLAFSMSSRLAVAQPYNLGLASPNQRVYQ